MPLKNRSEAHLLDSSRWAAQAVHCEYSPSGLVLSFQNSATGFSMLHLLQTLRVRGAEAGREPMPLPGASAGVADWVGSPTAASIC